MATIDYAHWVTQRVGDLASGCERFLKRLFEGRWRPRPRARFMCSIALKPHAVVLVGTVLVAEFGLASVQTEEALASTFARLTIGGLRTAIMQLSHIDALSGSRASNLSTGAVLRRVHRRVANSVPRVYQASAPLSSAEAVHTANVPSNLLQGRKHDVVLSSGFLAFANHSGFLQAVEEAGIEVSGVMGTSAGALAGSLYCAGYTPQQVAAELSRDAPINLLSCSKAPWRGGVLSLDGVIERLRSLLPPTFEDLEREFAVGVVTADGQHLLIDSGPLPEAVVASAAIPVIFESVDIPGLEAVGPFKDGGLVDRVGLKAWRERRRAQAATQGLHPSRVPPALVHVISRSSPFSGVDNVEADGEPHVTVVHSPKSGVNFFSLGDFETQLQSSMVRAQPLLARALSEGRAGGSRPSSLVEQLRQ